VDCLADITLTYCYCSISWFVYFKSCYKSLHLSANFIAPSVRVRTMGALAMTFKWERSELLFMSSSWPRLISSWLSSLSEIYVNIFGIVYLPSRIIVDCSSSYLCADIGLIKFSPVSFFLRKFWFYLKSGETLFSRS